MSANRGRGHVHGDSVEARPLVDPERGPALRRWVQKKRLRLINRAIDDDLITVEQGRELERLWDRMDDE